MVLQLDDGPASLQYRIPSFRDVLGHTSTCGNPRASRAEVSNLTHDCVS